MRKLNLLLSLVLALLSVSPALAAGKIYKSVDEQGNVIYSEKPLPGRTRSKEIAVPPPPTPEEVRRSEEEARQIKEKANAMEAARKAREQAQRAAPAEAPVGGAPARSGPSEAEKATGISNHPQLPPDELEKYLKDQSYIPPTPAAGPPPK